jgi:hypothetical protein
VVRNFIWGGKATNARAKVKWDTLSLPISKGGLGIIDPKMQSKALLTKLLVRGLTPGGEPWKKLVRHKADQIRLPMHGKGPSTPDINWIFVAPKFKKLLCSIWKSIIGAWINVRLGLTKSNPTNVTEIFKQSLFGNPSITNSNGMPLGVSGLRESCAFACSGCTKIKDLWSPEDNEWKSLSALGMSFHASNKSCKDITTTSIPWRLAMYTNRT